MKIKHLLLSSAMTLSALGTAQAVDVLVEDFETDGNGSRYVSSPEFRDSSSDHWGRTDGSDISNVSGPYSANGGTQFWAAEDTDDNGGNENEEQTLEFTGIDITGLQNLSFSALFGAGNASGSGGAADGGYDDNDSIVIQYKIDGGSYVNGMCFSYEAPGGGDVSNEPLTLDADCTDFADHNDGTNRLSPALQSYGFDIPVTGAVLDILITVNMESAKEEVAFDNIVVSGDAGDSAPTVTSTIPVDAAVDVAVDATITVNFSEIIDATVNAVTLTCDAQPVSFSGLSYSGAQMVLTPDSDLANDAVCAVNVVAAEVTDQDGTVDNMVADYGFGFTVESLVVLPPAIIINEFQSDPHADNGDANGDGTSSTTQDEFVELYNNSGAELDVSGWTLADAAAVKHTFPANSLIPADCSLVVFAGGTPTGAFGQSVVQTASTGGLGLNNGGDTITVSDGLNDIAFVDYNGTASTDQASTLDPDVTGLSFVDHSTAAGSGGALFSPGTKIDGSVFAGCPAPVDVAPVVTTTAPADAEMNVAVDSTVTVNFSEAVDVTVTGITLSCDAQNVAFSGLPAMGASIEITPLVDLSFNAACSVNVVAAEVTDQDGSVDNMAADYAFNFVVVAAPQLREIFEIQGSGLTSPYVGLTVITENNIVTALDSNGFFMQTPNARDDMDVNTSNGIYVYTGNNVPVAEGDDINLTGTIDEYHESTQFTFGSTIVINSSLNALPTAITFDDTFPPTDPMIAACFTDQETAKYECMEGMLIDMPQGFISSAYADYYGANIGDLVVKAGSERAYREAGIDYPGVGGSIPTFDGNPELFEVDIDELLLSPGYYSAGSEIAIEGVMGYNFGEYEVWPKSLTVITENVLPGVVRDAQAQEVTVASFNLFRLFNDIDDVGEEDDNAVATTQEYQDKLAKLSNYVINSLKSPMIVAVQEVENLNTLTALADKINVDSGLNYQAELVEGNDRGGIDVGVLYQSNVSIVEVNQLGKDTIFDFDQSKLHDRPPLHVQADIAVGFDTFRVNLIVVHLRSRGSIDDVSEGHRVRLKRMTQANDVASMVSDIEANNTGEAVIVLGDFNAFQFTDGYVDVMGQIDGTAVEAENTLWSEPEFVAAPMSQAVQYLSPEAQYSYVYQGDAQVLDNAVLNDEALVPFMGIEFGRGNADANIDFEADTQSVLRASDHDGLVLYFTVELDVIFKHGFE